MSRRRKSGGKSEPDKFSLWVAALAAAATVTGAAVTASGGFISSSSIKWQFEAQERVRLADSYSQFLACEESFNRAVVNLAVISACETGWFGQDTRSADIQSASAKVDETYGLLMASAAKLQVTQTPDAWRCEALEALAVRLKWQADQVKLSGYAKDMKLTVAVNEQQGERMEIRGHCEQEARQDVS